jgi:N-glycosylase/DNA lyase
MWKSKVVPTPKEFSFGLTVRSHGWYALAPFRFDEVRNSLSYTFVEKGGRPIRADITEVPGGVKVELDRAVSEKNPILEKVRHMLRLDEDLNDFYTEFCSSSEMNWVRERGAGRLLRSPTVFEDLVKTMCTTNCSWGLTEKMVANLVERLGNGSYFPGPEAMAEQGEDFYRNEIKAGYRSPFFVELARSVASKSIDPEEWLSDELPTDELKKQIKSLKGIGDYAAENMLKLLGRYDGLALDSWLRAQFYKKHNSGKTCSDKKIEKRYSKFGKWRGLAIWCDMTEDWHSRGV